MELDKRIKEGKRPLNCFDTEQAKQFIGKKCYFSDDARDFMNLDKADGDTLFYVAELQNIWTAEEYCFADNSNDWRFILPFEWVKPEEHVKPEEPEKKYRSFKDHTEYKEYLNDGIIESWIQIREKLTGEVSELMYVGGSGAIICLGAYSFDLNNLFYDFELFNESTGEWQPFGVLDE